MCTWSSNERYTGQNIFVFFKYFFQGFFLSYQRLPWRQDRKPKKQCLFFYHNLHSLYSDEHINSLMTEVALQEYIKCYFHFGSDTDMGRVLSAYSVLQFSWNLQRRKISDTRETPIGYFRFLAVEISDCNSLWELRKE